MEPRRQKMNNIKQETENQREKILCSLSYEKNEIVIISTAHPFVSISKLTKNHLKYVFIFVSISKLTKNHLKYVFICKISFKSDVLLHVHHETSLKIQFKV